MKCRNIYTQYVTTQIKRAHQDVLQLRFSCISIRYNVIKSWTPVCTSQDSKKSRAKWVKPGVLVLFLLYGFEYLSTLCSIYIQVLRRRLSSYFFPYGLGVRGDTYKRFFTRSLRNTGQLVGHMPSKVKDIVSNP